jgi:hypothetical protein
MIVQQRLVIRPTRDHVRLAGRVNRAYRNCGCRERRSRPSYRIGDKRITRSCMIVEQRIVGALRNGGGPSLHYPGIRLWISFDHGGLRRPCDGERRGAIVKCGEAGWSSNRRVCDILC